MGENGPSWRHGRGLATQPWPVSNGDLIREGHSIHFLISLACWFALFLATYPLLRLLLPKAKKPDT
jgi:hypothetical protein